MQPDFSSPQAGGQRYNSSGQGGQGSSATAYMSRTVESNRQGMGRVAESIADQIQGRPLIAGSIFLGMVGAIIGSRIAQMRMQRPKTPFQRAQGIVASIGYTVAGTVGRRATGRVDSLRDRGQGLSGTAMGIRESILEGMPFIGAPRGRFGSRQSTIRQVGYALSLIPVTMAFLRNPLVRDLGARMLSRRMRRRQRVRLPGDS